MPNFDRVQTLALEAFKNTARDYLAGNVATWDDVMYEHRECIRVGIPKFTLNKLRLR